MTTPLPWRVALDERTEALTPLEEKVLRMRYGVPKRDAAPLARAGGGDDDARLAALERKVRRAAPVK